SSSSTERRFHRSDSACQPALSRAIEGADSGAPSPSSPRKARSKSPWANPCRYSSGNSRPTSSVRRLNAGSSRLSKRSLSPRTRGRRSVIVPLLRLSRRGLPQPSRLAPAVPIARRRVNRVAPLIPRSAQDAVDLFLQHLLQQPLHALPRECLQAFPHRP